MVQLFYIVQEGTNVRAVGRDGKPVTVEEGKVDKAMRHYSHAVASPLGPWEALTVDEYFERYVLPTALAGQMMKRRAKEIEEAAAEARENAQLGVEVEA